MFALLKTFRPDLAPPLVDVTAAAMALRRINKVRTQLALQPGLRP